MKKFKIIFFFFLTFLFMTNIEAKEKADVYLFHADYCPHCRAEYSYLEGLDNINFHHYEISASAENSNLMGEVLSKLSIDTPYIPVTIIGDTYYIGFNDSVKEKINESINKDINENLTNAVDMVINNKDVSSITMKDGMNNNIEPVDNKLDIYLFHSKLCTHCQAEIEFLNTINNVNIHLYETTENKDNDTLMKDIKSKMGIDNLQVPFTIIGNTYYIGFEDSIKESMTELIKKEAISPSIDVVSKILNNESIEGITINNGEINNIHTIFGDINPNEVSLPILSIIIGFIDGFNPCAMWVLLFLISMIIGMKNRKKMWVLGLTFLITSALVYLGFLLAWLKISLSLTQISWVRLLIALIALIGGGLNLYNYLKERKQDNGCHVVDNKKRKSMLKKIKGIMANVDSNNSKGFILAILGIIGLAVSVNLVELACSSGLPLIFTQILAINNISSLEYIICIALYIIFFLIDDIVIFVIAMKSLKVTGISTKYNKLSHLIGGIIMILIGLLMIFKPEWLMFNF